MSQQWKSIQLLFPRALCDETTQINEEMFAKHLVIANLSPETDLGQCNYV